MWWRLLFCAVVGALHLWAQERSEPVRLRGSLNATAETYSSSGESPVQRYMPRYGMRLFFRPVLVLFGRVELPFELSWSTSAGLQKGYPTAFQQPFNQFGLSPQLTSWLRLHGGYFSLRLSELSFGDLRVLGGGIELEPGAFRLRALYGVVQHPRPLDTASGFPGLYRRWAWGGSLGFATQGGTELLLHFVRLRDDTNSIRLVRVVRDSLRTDTVVTPGVENAVAALSFRAPLHKTVTLQGEVALSAYSSSLRAPEKDLGIPRWLFVPRYSSNVDGAAKATVTVAPSQKFSLALGGRWIGPGFTTLGYPQLAGDIAEITLAPSFQLGTVSVRFSGGLQWNNLRNTRLGTTRRFITSTGIGWQPSQAFGVDLQYSNYGMRMEHQNDTFRVQNLYHNVSVAPRWQFSGWGGTHMLFLTYNFSQSTDRNPVSSPTTEQRTHTVVLSHGLAFPSTLNFSTMVTYTSTHTPQLGTELWMLGETVSYGFIPQRLTGSAGVSVSRMRTQGWDTQWGLNLTLSYSLQSWGMLSWTALLNRSQRVQGSFTEFQMALSYGLTF